VHALHEIIKTTEAQLGEIVESQILILARFAGKPKPNPVENLKMIRADNHRKASPYQIR
jgi:hypothetical protein